MSLHTNKPQSGESKTVQERTCNKCGWVAFGVSRGYARLQVKTFNEYYDALPVDKQQSYYGGRKASIEDYESCHCGNSYINFRPAVDADSPIGCTLNPILLPRISHEPPSASFVSKWREE